MPIAVPAHDSDRGSAPVEFVLVGLLLSALTFAIIQLGIAVYVRNIAHDAAVEGAYYAALADTSATDGISRARRVLDHTLGRDDGQSVTARLENVAGVPGVVVTVRTTMPVIGLLGIPGAWEVSARAPLESFERR